MKRFLSLFVAVALGLSLGACGGKDTPSAGDDTSLLDYLYQNGRVTRDVTLQSDALHRQMKYSVWLPKAYDESKSYPVLYLLHGYGDDNNSWLDKGDMAALTARYVQSGGVEMIVVMPDGLTSFYAGDYETYLYGELMPAVETKYPCNGKRAIAGLSMGGYGTLYHALSHPDRFTYAYAMSPAVMGNMTGLVDAVSDKSVFPGITIEVGTEDFVVDNSASKALADHLTAQGVSCEWVSRSGAHDWTFWQACLPKALTKIGNTF